MEVAVLRHVPPAFSLGAPRSSVASGTGLQPGALMKRVLAQVIQLEGKKVSLQIFGGKKATEECTTAECSFRKG